MNLTETSAALANIAQARVKQFTDKQATLAPDAAEERRALIIAAQMAKHAADFAAMVATDAPQAKTEVVERRIFREFPYFTACEADYAALADEDAKGMFRAYAFAVGMVRCNHYDRRWAEFESGEGSAAQRFACSVICGVLGDILEEWQEWWGKNGCISCEVPE